MEISKLLEVLKLSDLEATDENGNTALHLTVGNETFTQKEMIDSLQILLDRGINTDIKNKYNETVLQLAVVYRMKDVVDFLISREINMNSVAHFFIEHEYKRFLKLTKQENISNELASEKQRIENESANYVECLISKGFDFDWKNESNESALDMAIEYNLQHVLLVLLKYTKNTHFNDRRYTTLLYSFLDKLSFDSRFGYRISQNWYSDRYAAHIVKIFLDRGVSADVENYYQCTPAQVAFEVGADYKVMELLIVRSTKIDHKNNMDESLLQMVMRYFNVAHSNESKNEHHLKILRDIIAKGANVNDLNIYYKYGSPALCEAVPRLNMHVIEFLQTIRADFGVTTKNGDNLLHLLSNSYAVSGKQNIDVDAQITLFNLLISKGCQVNAKNKDGKTPLYEAVYHDNLTIARKLIEHGAEVNYKTNDVESPLQIAVGMRYDLRMVELLRQHGADFGVTTKDHENALHLFVKRPQQRKIDDDVEMTLFNLLIDEGSQVNAKDVKGNTPLHNAVTYDNVSIVQKLLEHGAEVNCKTNDGMAPLQIAVAKRHEINVIELLQENGADFSVVTQNDENLLHLLFKRPNYLKTDDETEIKLFNLLISKGCQANAKDKNGKTPLHEAVNHDKVPIIRNLIEHGAEVNCTTSDGETPLLIAATKKYNPCVVELLRDNGADANVTTKDGKTLIHHLLKSSGNLKIDEESQVKLFNMIVTEECQINAKDETGTSLIHVAALYAKVPVIRLLIERGADVNCRNNQKETPLHLSRTNSEATNVAQLLLQHGANVNAQDSQGQTALHKVAKEPRSDESGGTVFTLLEYGADVNKKDTKGITALNYARNRDKENYENKRREWIQKTYHYEDEDDYYDDDRLTPENYYENVTEWASWPVILLTWHSIKLRAANLPWDRKMNGWLGDFEMFAGSNYSHEQHNKDCLIEVGKLEETFIDNRVSLYSFLRMNLSSRCVYVNNEELQKLVQSPSKLEEQFPEYFVLILANYREANTRKSLLESAKETWLELTKIALPDLCLECIFSFLSNSELIDMIEKY